jgi:membrane-associated phospholipid phosphatase
MTWQSITDLGDSAVTLSLAGFILAFLLADRRRADAGAWLVAVAACAAGVAFVKILFHSCAHDGWLPWLNNPSGHTAMSTLVYGGLAVLLVHGGARWRRIVLPAAAALVVGAIAISRIALHAHDRAEVMAGLVVGLAAILLFRRLRRNHARSLSAFAMMGGASLVVAAMWGIRWPVEPYLSGLAALIHHNVPLCGG